MLGLVLMVCFPLVVVFCAYLAIKVRKKSKLSVGTKNLDI